MFIADLNYPATYQQILKDPVWQQALAWLKNEAANKTDGEYAIQGRDLYAAISSLTTKPRAECKFEAHQKYIDIHYCIDGEEIIEWVPVDTLTPTMDYNEEKDYCLYQTPDKTIAIHFIPGLFGIFLPADAHMPKVAVGDSPSPIKKAVIKVNADLIVR